MRKVFNCCSILLLLAASPDLARGQTKGDSGGRVMALREATLKSGVSKDEFERYFSDSVAIPLSRHVPGVRAHLLRGDRGARVGGYVILFEFESVAKRNAYYPRPDSSSALYQRVAKKMPPNAIANLTHYVDIAPYTDYVVIR